MGCWNKTCGISQFPIMAGDKTVNFILVQSQFAYRDNTPCYPSSMGWKLIPIPFYGEYNDYGWQDDDEGQQAKYDFLREHYKDDLVEVEREKSRAKLCYDPMVTPFDNNKTLGDSIHGNVWNLKNHMYPSYGGPETRMMANFMVNRIVWDALTEKVLQTYPEHRWHTRSDIAGHIAAYMEFVDKREQEIRAEIIGDQDDKIGRLLARASSMIRIYREGGAIEEYATAHFGNKSYDDPRRTALFRLDARGSEETMEITIMEALVKDAITPDEAAAVFLMDNAMSSLRKAYMPQVGEGSQEGIDYHHTLLLKAMKDIIKHDKKRYEDF